MSVALRSAPGVTPAVIHNFGTSCAEAVGVDGYNAAITGNKSATLGVNCGMSSGRNGVLVHNGTSCAEVVVFAQNQRNEVRILGDKTGALQAQPGMKQQTFVLDSIGGQTESFKATKVAPTLKASHHKFPPCVMEGCDE